MGVAVKNYPMYEVNEDGSVFSRYTNKTLKTNVSRTGYHTVELFNKEGSKRLLVHRIVAEAFLPNPFGLPQVNHKDEDKGNNAVSNLEWCTAKYNMNYGHMGKIRHTLIDYTKPVYKEVGNRLKDVCRIPVNQILQGKIIASFASEAEAFKITGIRHISEVCTGKRKSAGGYTWQYRKE